jgi:hypothetical protein
MRAALGITVGAAVIGFALLTGAPGATPVAVASSCDAETFHDESREGGVCCFSDHFHYGSSGPGFSSRAKAVSAAVGAWSDFVYLEYGGDYDHWGLAHSKSVNCSNSGGWSCDVSARPCHGA